MTLPLSSARRILWSSQLRSSGLLPQQPPNPITTPTLHQALREASLAAVQQQRETDTDAELLRFNPPQKQQRMRAPRAAEAFVCVCLCLTSGCCCCCCIVGGTRACPRILTVSFCCLEINQRDINSPRPLAPQPERRPLTTTTHSLEGPCCSSSSRWQSATKRQKPHLVSHYNWVSAALLSTAHRQIRRCRAPRCSNSPSKTF